MPLRKPLGPVVRSRLFVVFARGPFVTSPPEIYMWRKTMEAERVCQECKHWSRLDYPPQQGECRFNPPIGSRNSFDENVTTFPVTNQDDFCGQFEEGDDA